MTEDKPKKMTGPYADWLRSRTATLLATVSASDILARNGVRLRYGGARAEQIFCPFHSNNRTMAAKYHPNEPDSTAGIYCFVCQKRWDAIGIWRQFEGMAESKFSTVLRAMEAAYDITPPEMPASAQLGFDVEEGEAAEIEMLLEVCERRLKGAREVFDLRGYLLLGTALDRLRHGLDKQLVPIKVARAATATILDKIGARCRAS